MKKYAHIILIFFYSSVIFTWCSDRWQGTVYLHKQNLVNYRNIGEFATLEECRSAYLCYLEDINALEIDDYECKKNCKYNSDLGVYICKETLR
ncbi:MAG: hypothetical protein AMJ42_02930 [Deltaproteobacteria bacterium DG_8]|nr:MAG: hypothetical protein AMJ42_02930 [Deltaproteobacteria bacterium DG_8]